MRQVVQLQHDTHNNALVRIVAATGFTVDIAGRKYPWGSHDAHSLPFWGVGSYPGLVLHGLALTSLVMILVVRY